MTADTLKSILDPIQRRWLPLVESASEPEWRAHYFRAAISEAFITGRQSMLQPRTEGTDSPNDPLLVLPAIAVAQCAKGEAGIELPENWVRDVGTI